jgi:hypothetical protein
MQIAEDSGFFPAVFLTTPNPMLSERPDGELGPRYTIVYVMPGPSGVVDEIRQDVYPYATPSLVSYTKPGQPYFGTERTVGGWYVAGPTLKDDLVAVGLRATAPPAADDAGRISRGKRSGYSRSSSLSQGWGSWSCAHGAGRTPRRPDRPVAVPGLGPWFVAQALADGTALTRRFAL